MEKKGQKNRKTQITTKKKVGTFCRPAKNKQESSMIRTCAPNHQGLTQKQENHTHNFISKETFLIAIQERGRAAQS